VRRWRLALVLQGWFGPAEHKGTSDVLWRDRKGPEWRKGSWVRFSLRHCAKYSANAGCMLYGGVRQHLSRGECVVKN
jgi:hypothetical protein